MTLRGNPAYLSSVSRDVLGEAQQAHREGRLGFLVGAGLSVPIGLPGWSSFNQVLVREVLERHEAPLRQKEHRLANAYMDQLQGQSLAAAEFARRRAGADFHIAVQAALYDRPELASYQPNSVHYALAQLAVESKPPFPVLHTTNYDDLLERALGHVAGAKARAIHLGHRLTTDGPRVVHLHGYFPFDAPQKQRARLARDLVLSDLDFSRLSNDHSAWTNRELLALLDARAVLILGMSLTDPNVRRLLAYLSDRKRTDGSAHYVILLHRSITPSVDGGAHDPVDEAAHLLDEDEYNFWRDLGVKILRIQTWDRLNYLLRRIRFGDDDWDRRHQELRIAWAQQHYGQHGPLDFDDPTLQRIGTEGLIRAREALVAAVGLTGRVELNLYLPLLDGSYRRVLSSMPGRATEAPRPFVPSHDRVTIPEIEEALIVGQTSYRSELPSQPPPPAQPAFQTWYRSLVSVPTFDDACGGVPVALIQLMSSERSLKEGLDGARLTRLSAMLREVVAINTHLLGTLPRP